MSDALITPISQPIGDGDGEGDDHRDWQLPIDSAATRHLCAGDYVDRSFRDRIIHRIHNDARRRIAPSYGFDLVPVVRHAWWSWVIDTGQLLAMLGGLIGGVLMGGLLAAMTVWCAIALCLLLRGIIWVFPQVLRLRMEAVSEQWGRSRRASRRRRLLGPDLRSCQRQLKAMFLAGLLVALTPGGRRAYPVLPRDPAATELAGRTRDLRSRRPREVRRPAGLRRAQRGPHAAAPDPVPAGQSRTMIGSSWAEALHAAVRVWK